jgi:hypothetical protein
MPCSFTSKCICTGPVGRSLRPLGPPVTLQACLLLTQRPTKSWVAIELENKDRRSKSRRTRRSDSIKDRELAVAADTSPVLCLFFLDDHWCDREIPVSRYIFLSLNSCRIRHHQRRHSKQRVAMMVDDYFLLEPWVVAGHWRLGQT